VGEKNREEGRNGTTKMKNEENKYARESKEHRNKGGRKKRILIPLRGFILEFNPFQPNFSANRILPNSYLFWAVKRLVDYL
jgi:hypothetical protein